MPKGAKPKAKIMRIEEAFWEPPPAHFEAFSKMLVHPTKADTRYFDFRQATPATWEYFYKTKEIFPLTPANEIPSGPRRNQRLFWRHEFDPPPDMPGLYKSSPPDFFYSIGEG